MNLDDLWGHRALLSVTDHYRGRVLAKMPEDLRTYQRLIEATKPEVIVELGTFDGGSAMWFADQLRTLTTTPPSVITVDITRSDIPDDAVTRITGDLSYEAGRVESFVAGRRCMVVDDSAHTYKSTSDALRLYSGLVSEGCYFVVEDGIVEEKDVCPPQWYAPGTVKRAIDEFVAAHAEFKQHFYADYVLTTNHGGWLERV